MANQTARPTAAEEAKVERRRRQPGTLDRMAARKLAIPEDVRAENSEYALRWANDSGNRIYALTTQDDWEKVPGIEPRPVDTDGHGKPIMGHLLRKKKEFWDEDQKVMIDGIKERERGLMRAAKSDPADNRPDDLAYAVSGNSVSTGSYKP